ncbi:response regulator, partial [Proteus terrae]
AQVSAEALKRDGVAACLLKPLTTTRLLPALVATNHAPASAPLTQADSHKLPMTVMAVDDNPANLKLIGALLDDLVQQVILCDSGQQAVDQAKRLQMDLILMDIQMPDMDGVSLALELSALPEARQSQIIMLSSMSRHFDANMLKRIGIAHYLHKPVAQRELHQVIAGILLPTPVVATAPA